MNQELIGFSLYFGFALIASAIVVVGLGIFLQIQQHYAKWIVQIVPPLIAGAIITSSLLSGRNLAFAAFDIEFAAGGVGAPGAMLLRVFTLIIVGLCTAVLVSSAFTQSNGSVHRPLSLLISFIAFFVCNFILNSALGTYPALLHNSIYCLLMFSAVYISRESSFEQFIVSVKFSLVTLMIVSLIAAIAAPTVAIEPNYVGMLPGVNFRLWGVGSSANSIGPLALSLLLLEIFRPFPSSILRSISILSAIIVLLLAQSKTTWGVFAVVLLPLLWYRYGRREGGGIRIGFLFALIGLLGGIAAALLLLDVGLLLDRFTGSKMGSQALTLTGRVGIWNAAINAWLDNPLFGFGPTAWGTEHRAQIGMNYAVSAHNQLLQSLSSAGLFGGVTLLIYFTVISVLAFQRALATRGFSLALLLLLLIRSVTEAPLALNTPFNGDVLMHLLMFRLLLLPVAKVPSKKLHIEFSGPVRHSHA
jgi:O-antigen ligase